MKLQWSLEYTSSTEFELTGDETEQWEVGYEQEVHWWGASDDGFVYKLLQLAAMMTTHGKLETLHRHKYAWRQGETEQLIECHVDGACRTTKAALSQRRPMRRLNWWKRWTTIMTALGDSRDSAWVQPGLGLGR